MSTITIGDKVPDHDLLPPDGDETFDEWDFDTYEDDYFNDKEEEE